MISTFPSMKPELTDLLKRTIISYTMQNSVIQTYLKVKLSAFTLWKIFPSILYRIFFIKYSNKQNPLKNYEVKAVTFIATVQL
jgi:hypothetical protein